MSEYFERLADGLEAFRIADDPTEFDDRVVASIENFLPFRNEAISVMRAVSRYGPRAEDIRALHRFFERMCRYMHRPADVSSWRESDFDNFRFIGRELFLYATASLMREERFDHLASLLRETYIVGTEVRQSDGISRFVELCPDTPSLEHRNTRLKTNRTSIRADLLKERSTASGFDFRSIMEADFVLWLRDAFDVLRDDNRWQRWWPDTLIYAGGAQPLDAFARAESLAYFNRLKIVFDINTKTDFDGLFEAASKQIIRAPQWGWHTLGVAHLTGYAKLATRP